MDLHNIDGPEALAWVTKLNTRTIHRLEKAEGFEQLRTEALEILNDKGRIPSGWELGGFIYNFWKDDTHKRGVLRRMPTKDYVACSDNWELLLDVDALSAVESTNWSYAGFSWLPGSSRAMIYLSAGGEDAKEAREFCLDQKAFVEGGFYSPRAKQGMCWVDENRLLIETDFGEASLTRSGYPCVLKLWERGQSLDQARTVIEGGVNDLGVWDYLAHEGGQSQHYVHRMITWDRSQLYAIDGEFKTHLLPIPETAHVMNFNRFEIFALLKDPWEYGGTRYEAGDFVGLRWDLLLSEDATAVRYVLKKSETQFVQGAHRVGEKLFVEVLEDVSSKILAFDLKATHLSPHELELPGFSTLSMQYGDSEAQQLFVMQQSFLQPNCLYTVDPSTLECRVVRSLKSQFNLEDFQTQQFFAESRDGTRVPYFLVSKKNLPLDSTNPTLLYAYGGFEHAQLPLYEPLVLNSWVQEGGVYVVANIRGGSEYGSDWHKAALREKRQNAFDDFYAVAEDLIAKKYCSPKCLGICGGSNGGLLAGVAITQRPELFSAALIQVPLLDMLQYHRLLAGASWMAEYGDPDKPSDRAFIEAYSPMQNVKKGVHYPEIFIMTSTRDDRVHPAHARRFAKLFEDYDHPFYYFENTEGGHGGVSNNDQQALWTALEYIYLREKLRG